jgi:DNA-binding transcriptional MerR regulator
MRQYCRIIHVMKHQKRYSVGELAELGDVSRRTVRYYVQEGLIPTPYGLGRGSHYGPEHLEELLRVKAMQEQGMSLEAVRRCLSGEAAASVPLAKSPTPVPRSQWMRMEVIPGVEIHVSSRRRVPPPEELEELADWCRRHFRRDTEGNDD